MDNPHATLAAQYESTRQWLRLECLKIVAERGNFHEASAFIEKK
jgi:hypothetical protein